MFFVQTILAHVKSNFVGQIRGSVRNVGLTPCRRAADVGPGGQDPQPGRGTFGRPLEMECHWLRLFAMSFWFRCGTGLRPASGRWGRPQWVDVKATQADLASRLSRTSGRTGNGNPYVQLRWQSAWPEILMSNKGHPSFLGLGVYVQKYAAAIPTGTQSATRLLMVGSLARMFRQSATRCSSTPSVSAAARSIMGRAGQSSA